VKNPMKNAPRVVLATPPRDIEGNHMKHFEPRVRAHRLPARRAAAAAILGAALAMGCGGGGGDAEGGSAATPSPLNYSGTYVCTTLHGAITAVLTTAAGSFSSCSGSATPHPGDTRTITCQGSISHDGAFNISGVDSRGILVQYAGTATATNVTGTFYAGGTSLPFECTR
jgi:hypothetical protein